MATSAFKSTSRRATAAAEPKAHPPAAAAASRRRSHSVSAVSRRTHLPFGDNTSISAEFSNSRDNPLFWATSSSPPDKEESGKINEIDANDRKQSYSVSTGNTRDGDSGISSGGEQRGRSSTRSFSHKNGIGRSLSRVRGRSMSRAPSGAAYEIDKEHDMVTSTIAPSKKEVKKIDNGINRVNLVRSRVDTWSRAKNAGVTKTRNQATDWSEDDSACSLQISNLEDGISIGSLSEGEEKTIKAVYEDLNLTGEKRGGDMPPSEIYATVRSEVRRAISDIQNDLEGAFRRNNAHTFTARNVADLPSDLVNPEAVEFISDIRREYAVKLEESGERARKLRADLAFEQQRGHELDRILKEILPDPSIQRSRRGRRTSNERKRMSKHLTEEAMAYFDECVSLSTFDSSDFSATEDPHYTSVGIAEPDGASSLVNGSGLPHKQLYNCEDSELTAESSVPEQGSTQLYQFSFGDEKSENSGHQEDIRSCIKNFERCTDKDKATRSYYDAGEYSVHGQIESMLIDRVLYSSRIESGGLILCGGAASFSPFASVI